MSVRDTTLRSPLAHEITRLARASAPRAVQRLLTELESGDDSRARIEAAKVLLAYAVGLPVKMKPETLAEAAAADPLAGLSLEQVLAIARGESPGLAVSATDSTATH